MRIPLRFARTSRVLRRGGRRVAAVGSALTLLGSLAGSLVVAGEPGPHAGDATPIRELGRRLFFDPAASSRSGMRSCADCHLPEHAFSDPERRSADDTALTARHSQTLVDAGDSPTAHWDGEFDTMHALVVGRLNVQFDTNGNARYGNGRAVLAGGGGSGSTVSRLEFVRNVRMVGPSLPTNDVDALSLQQADPQGAPLPAPDTIEFHVLRTLPKNGSLGEALPELRPNGVDLHLPSASSGGAEPFPAFRQRGSFVFARASVQAAPSEPFAPFVNPSFAPFLPPAAASLAAAARYRDAFRAAFGSDEPSDTRIALAIAEFCHSIRSGESPYDRHVAGDESALSTSAKRGLALFSGEAGCARCHLLGEDGARAPFTDYRFHNTGIEQRSFRPGTDQGRFLRTRNPGDNRAFKTPTLRDVARRGPYMHDGSLATLEAVVRYYASNPADRDVDLAFPRFSPSDDDVADLVAFLRSLTSDVRPGLATTTWSDRAAATRLRFVDADGRPVAGLRVVVEPAGDALPGADSAREPEVLTTGPAGTISFAPFSTTHARLVLPSGVRPVGGDLVPDTCTSADVVVPLLGTARLRVVDATAATPPDVLVVRHPDAERFPGRRVPESRFRLRGSERAPGGALVSLYEAPYRTDVGDSGTVEWPRQGGGEPVATPVDLGPARTALLTLP